MGKHSGSFYLGTENQYVPRSGHGCICGKHMFQQENNGTCLWCGHGSAALITEFAYELNMRGNTSARLDARALATGLVPDKSKAAPGRAVWDEFKCIEAARQWEDYAGHLPKSSEWQGRKNGGPDHPSYGVVQKLFGGWQGFLKAIAEVPREQVAAA